MKKVHIKKFLNFFYLILICIIFALIRANILSNSITQSPLVIPVIQNYTLPYNNPTGLTFDGENLWISFASQKLIFSFDPITLDVKNTLNVSIRSPWGLAWDGEYLWVNDFTLNKIFQINTKNSTIINNINAPLISPTGLTHDGNYLWLSDTTNKNIYKINSFNGSIIEKLSTPFLILPTLTAIPGTVPANLSSLGCGRFTSSRTIIGSLGAYVRFSLYFKNSGIFTVIHSHINKVF